MTKKIRDLTIGEIKAICKTKKVCHKDCPLYNHKWLCLGLRNMTEKELNRKVEIKWDAF